MIMTRNVNKTTRLMGLTIMRVKQEFQEPKAPEDFRKIEYYFEDFRETHEQLGISGYATSARIIRRGIQVTKNCKAVSSKDSWNNGERFGASCINKINLE